MKEYFSHDYNSRDDEKIKRLIYSHGWAGYGLYWAIIEQLYQNNGFMLTEYERMGFDLRAPSDVIESIICDFALFKFKKDQFFSQSVLDRLEQRKIKSEKARSSATARWSDANAKRTQSDGNAIKEKESKEKNNKEKLNKSIEYYNKEAEEFEDENYRVLVSFLLGDNETNEPLEKCLLMNNPINRKNFGKLLEKSIENKRKLTATILALENDQRQKNPKKKYSSFSMTVSNWLENSRK
jgi:hypothetical protein